VFDWPFVRMIADTVWILFLGLSYMFLYVSFCVYLVYRFWGVLNFWVVIVLYCFSM
jgi:hypothetical protein